jgi:hypothetical protein
MSYTPRITPETLYTSPHAERILKVMNKYNHGTEKVCIKCKNVFMAGNPKHKLCDKCDAEKIAYITKSILERKII